MLKLSATSKLTPEEVIKRAVKFFSPDDYGLKRADYIAAFFKNIDWKAAADRIK